MAQKIQVLFIDDLDGGEAEGTVRFRAGRHRLRDRPEREKRGGAAQGPGQVCRCRPAGACRFPAAGPQRAQGR
jgi:hypothetical protein